MKEKWKWIKEYEGLYQISNIGRVRRNKKILKPLRDTNKYRACSLSKNGIVKRFRIHRLVAMHFIPNPKNKLQVNHKDGNRNNPSIKNLEWVTCSENHKHAFRVLGKIRNPPSKGKFGIDHNRSIGFYLIFPDKTYEYFGSGLEAKRKLGINNTSISYGLKTSDPYIFKRGKFKNFVVTKNLAHFQLKTFREAGIENI